MPEPARDGFTEPELVADACAEGETSLAPNVAVADPQPTSSAATMPMPAPSAERPIGKPRRSAVGFERAERGDRAGAVTR